MRVREITKPPHPTPRTCERSRGERYRCPRAPSLKHTTTTPIRPFPAAQWGLVALLGQKKEAASLTGPAVVACPFSPAHNSWYITCPRVWCVVYLYVEARDKDRPCRPTTSQPGASTSEMQQAFASDSWKSPRITSERGFALGLASIRLEIRLSFFWCRKDMSSSLGLQLWQTRTKRPAQRQTRRVGDGDDGDGDGDFVFAIPIRFGQVNHSSRCLLPDFEIVANRIKSLETKPHRPRACKVRRDLISSCSHIPDQRLRRALAPPSRTPGHQVRCKERK